MRHGRPLALLVMVLALALVAGASTRGPAPDVAAISPAPPPAGNCRLAPSDGWPAFPGSQPPPDLTALQGGGAFHLEHYNGRYHYAAFPGNDNLNPPCSEGGGFPAALDCDISPPERWLGFAAKPWRRDAPPQFTQASLPFQQMIDARTGEGIVNRDTGATGGWSVVRRDSYGVMACTQAASDTSAAYDAAKAAVDKALADYFAGFQTPGADMNALLQKYLAANDAFGKLTPPSPLETNCASSGGGGNYLSNASAYRNTLMRDTFGLAIPAGHIHTPVMTYFGTGSDGKITDATFEGYRDSIVAQARNLVFAVARSLVSPPAP